MSMGMSMRVTMTQAQRLELSLEHKQAMLLACQQKVHDSIENLRAEIGIDSGTVARGVFEGVALLAADQVRDATVREALSALLTDPGNQAYMVKYAGNLTSAMNARDPSFLDFAGQAVVDGLDKDSNGQIVLPGEKSSRGVSRGRVIAALVDPEAVRESLKEETELAKEMKDSGQDPEGLLREISEKNGALEVAKFVAPYQRTMAALLKLSFCIKDEEGQPILRNFFREVDLLKSLDWDLSERISKRFVARFGSLRSSSSGHEYRDAMMNTIGEFVMVSLGVLDPSLFKRMRGEVKEMDVLFTDQNVDDTSNGKVSVVATMKKLSLRQSGTIYWCRWAIPGVKLSRHSDEAIRGLLRDVIGVDKDKTLTAMGYDAFVKDLREIKRSNNKSDALALFADRLQDTLARDEFRAYLIDRCTRSWYPALKQFLSAGERSRG